jgi:hypothetical protein
MGAARSSRRPLTVLAALRQLVDRVHRNRRRRARRHRRPQLLRQRRNTRPRLRRTDRPIQPQRQHQSRRIQRLILRPQPLQLLQRRLVNEPTLSRRTVRLRRVPTTALMERLAARRAMEPRRLTLRHIRDPTSVTLAFTRHRHHLRDGLASTCEPNFRVFANTCDNFPPALRLHEACSHRNGVSPPPTARSTSCPQSSGSPFNSSSPQRGHTASGPGGASWSLRRL